MGDDVDRGGGLGDAGNLAQRPLRGEQLEPAEPMLGEQAGRVLDAAVAEVGGATSVAPYEIGGHLLRSHSFALMTTGDLAQSFPRPGVACLGFTTGRSFGSTSARRCS